MVQEAVAVLYGPDSKRQGLDFQVSEFVNMQQAKGRE